jgi:predicted DNA-binding WGR domain protein
MSDAPNPAGLQEGTHDKSWKVAVAGNRLTVTWGRTGSAGRSKVKTLASPAAAAAMARKTGDRETEQGIQARAARFSVRTGDGPEARDGLAIAPSRPALERRSQSSETFAQGTMSRR